MLYTEQTVVQGPEISMETSNPGIVLAFSLGPRTLKKRAFQHGVQVW